MDLELKDLIEVIMLQRDIKKVDIEKGASLSKMTVRKIVNGDIDAVKLETISAFMGYLGYRVGKGEDLNSAFMSAESARNVLIGIIRKKYNLD